MVNKVQVEMTIKDKVFKQENGAEVEYVEIVGVLAGESVRFTVKKEDKSLFTFLRKKLPVTAK